MHYQMATLQVQKGVDNKILRTKSVEIELSGKKSAKKFKKLLDDMKETMLATDGVGLAAPQVGENIRVIICLLNQGSKNELITEMINPVIIHNSEEMKIGEEGCLSLPGEFGKVARYTEVKVRFLNLKGEELVLKLKELNAVIVQHEIDHLDGKLFVDRITEQALMGKHIL